MCEHPTYLRVFEHKPETQTPRHYVESCPICGASRIGFTDPATGRHIVGDWNVTYEVRRYHTTGKPGVCLVLKY